MWDELVRPYLSSLLTPVFYTEEIVAKDTTVLLAWDFRDRTYLFVMCMYTWRLTMIIQDTRSTSAILVGGMHALMACLAMLLTHTAALQSVKAFSVHIYRASMWFNSQPAWWSYHHHYHHQVIAPRLTLSSLSGCRLLSLILSYHISHHIRNPITARMYYCLLSGSIVHSYVRIIRVLITRKQCQCSSHSYPWRAFAFLPRPGLPPTSITTITPMCTPSHNPRFDSTWPKSYMHHSHHLPYCASLHPSNRLLSYPDISPPAVDPLPFYLVSLSWWCIQPLQTRRASHNHIWWVFLLWTRQTCVSSRSLGALSPPLSVNSLSLLLFRWWILCHGRTLLRRSIDLQFFASSLYL